MRRETQNILLVLLGGALLKISLDGSYLRYVKPAQQPWLVIAGAVMVALAVVSIGRDFVARWRAVHDRPHHGDHHSDHHGGTAWLLLLPVLALLLIAPPALGADAVNRSDGRTVAPIEIASSDDDLTDFPPLPAESPFEDTLSDFNARAGWDRAHSLNGRPVRLTGFVVHKGSDTYLARLVIICCAADASPMKVRLVGTDVESMADDTWLQATVVLVPGSSVKANDWIPSATVVDARKIHQPKDPYEY